MVREKLARQSGAKQANPATPGIISESWAASVVPTREAGAHKWGVGGVVVVAGSPAFAGAAALCCAGAGRSGAGIVSAALPRSIAPVVVGLVPEVTVVILPEGESNSVALRAAEAIGERLGRSAAMVIGPGLGNDAATAALLGTLFGFTRTRGSIGFGTTPPGSETAVLVGAVATAGKPVVVDADALTWLAEQDHWWERVPAGILVLTPHPGEMARLVDVGVGEIVANPERIAREAATRWGQTVVLKGGRTVVAGADGAISTADAPPSLATAGSGDVLCGSIGGLLAQGLSGPDAAALAVFVGSRAAQRVSEQYGTLGVVAGDLPQAIAAELRALEEMGA
jgi:ADP-dependent NAD(P)H-hydrate dehydratase / NAD(P)H-hydrate epimerase